MLHIKSLEDGLDIFKALGSEIRIEILKILMENEGMNMNELATRLGVTNGALTAHIKKLEDCGLVMVSNETSGHGNQKKCMAHLDKILIDMETQNLKNTYQTDIKVGHFSDFNVYPTCGLASSTALIGEEDDTRYFAHPDRYNADILWFTMGYVEYVIPNFVPSGQKIDQITISMEIGSEAPGVSDVWPSDISFSLNNTKIAEWTSPGDFGSMRGIFTPDWWYPNWNQYGMLKILVINRKGTFIDGLQVSNVSISDFDFDCRSTIKLRLAVEKDAKHVGGLTIFGKNFGNYNQDISVMMNYSPAEEDNNKGEKTQKGEKRNA